MPGPICPDRNVSSAWPSRGVLAWVAVWALLAAPPVAWAGPQHVEQAVLLLRGGCALENAKLDMTKGNDGRLHLQLSTGGTPRARTSLVHTDVERFTDATMRLQGEQSLEASACMGQAVNQIIGTLLSLPPDVASLPLGPAPSAGGGYVPPMTAPIVPPPPVTATVVSPPAADVTSQSGPFEFSYSTVEIVPAPGSATDRYLQATMGVDIRNTGNVPLRLVFNSPWPVLQAEGGLQFDIRGGGISGVAYLGYANTSNCGSYATNFTVLRPGQTLTASLSFQTDLRGREAPSVNWGRLTGQILVQATDTGRCWSEPLAAPRLAVSMRR